MGCSVNYNIIKILPEIFIENNIFHFLLQKTYNTLSFIKNLQYIIFHKKSNNIYLLSEFEGWSFSPRDVARYSHTGPLVDCNHEYRSLFVIS